MQGGRGMQGSTTKKDIVKRISEKTGIQQTIVAKVVQMTLDSIIDVIAHEGNIELRNFGVFEVKVRKARKARNPKTSDIVDVPAKHVVTFKPGKVMEARIANIKLPEAEQVSKAPSKETPDATPEPTPSDQPSPPNS